MKTLTRAAISAYSIAVAPVAARPNPLRPGLAAPSDGLDTTDQLAAELSVPPTLLNTVFRLLPVNCSAAMITTEIRAAIKPYSIAVAPRSDLKNLRIFDIDVSSSVRR